MKNFFEELNEKGHVFTEIPFEQFIELFIQGRITSSQFSKILIENLGEKKYSEILQDTLKRTYSEKLLDKSIPEELQKIIQQNGE